MARIKPPKKPVMLLDALYNLAPRSGANNDYRAGLVVGLASGLMACGYTWEECMHLIAVNWPREGVISALPQSWQGDVVAALTKLGRMI